MSIKEQMLQARELIRAKQYDQARAILVTVDHPKAREWLARIDQIGASSPQTVPEVRPRRSSSKRGILVAGMVMVVLLVALVGLVLIVPNLPNPLDAGSSSDDAYSLARYFPDDTVVYFEIDTDDEHIESWDNLMVHIQASLPPFISSMLGADEPFTLSQSLDLLSQSTLNGDFQTTIRSWLGDQVVFGIYHFPEFDMEPTDPLEIGMAGVIQITNRDRTIAFMEQLLSFDPTLTFAQLSQGDYTVFRSSDATQHVILIDDRVMIIASPFAESIILNGIENPLYESPRFIETMTMLPESDYNFTLYLQWGEIFRSMMPMFEEMQSMFAELASTLPDDSDVLLPTSTFTFEDFLPEDMTMEDVFEAIGQFGIGFTIVDDYTLMLDGVHNTGNPELLQEFNYTIPNTEPINPKFLSFIPENTAMVMQGTDIQAYVDQMLASEQLQQELLAKYADQLRIPEEMQIAQVQSAIIRIDEIIQPVTELTVQEDIFSWMTGDYAIYIDYEDSLKSMLFSYYYPDEQLPQNIEVGMIIEVTDIERARTVIDLLGHAIPLILDDLEITVAYETIAGNSAIVVNIPPRDLLATPLEIVIGSNDEVFVIGTRKSTTDILNRQGGFDASSGYTRVQPRLLPDSDSMVYINTDGINFFADMMIGVLPAYFNEVTANMVAQFGEMDSEESAQQRQAMFEQQRLALPMTTQSVRWVTELIDSITMSVATNEDMDSISRFALTFAALE